MQAIIAIETTVRLIIVEYSFTSICGCGFETKVTSFVLTIY